MPLNFTAAHSSRVTKAKYKSPLQRRSSTTPLSDAPRKKPKNRVADDEDDDDSLFESRLDDRGLVHHLAQDLNLRDVAQQLRYVQDHMFDDIPERAGMNSTRIAEVLNFRRMLPRIVTVAHVHALSRSHTAAEREIVELLRKGVIRRIRIPGRGLGSSAVGECLVLAESWIKSVEDATTLTSEVKHKYVDALRRHPDSISVPAVNFESEEASRLIQAGYLTSGIQMAQSSSSTGSFSSLGNLSSVSTAGSRAATGTVAAVGGQGAIHDAGGGGSSLSTSRRKQADEYQFSLPSIGPYLRLLESSRNHLVDLLSKSRFKEAPRSLLKERWDGGVSPTDPEAKRGSRAKGLQAVVLPAKTRKWKMYYGLKFQWVLEECLGTGAIEIFETGSVGQGVRLP